MITIPAGTLQLRPEAARLPRKRIVPIRRFEIGRTEVTQGQWRAIMGSDPSHFSTCGDDCPVENVSWHDAQAYIRKLNARTGRIYRLPSEAEWEYAARAGSAGPYPWGASASHEHANYGEERCCWGHASGRDRWVSTTAPVASFPPNGFGLHDMHGNVWEWVQDADAANRSLRVLRGGCWFSGANDISSSARGKAEPGSRSGDAGFRLARTL